MHNAAAVPRQQSDTNLLRACVGPRDNCLRASQPALHWLESIPPMSPVV